MTVSGSVLARCAGQRMQVQLDDGRTVIARALSIPALGARVVLLEINKTFTQVG